MPDTNNLPALVVCDLAGTTIEDTGQVPGAFVSALAEHGIAVAQSDVVNVRGASKREAILRFIPDDDERAARADTVYATFRRILAERYAGGGVHAISGTETTFDWLRGRGIRIALNTGFDRDTVDLLVGSLGWRRRVVDAIVCGDDVLHGRPAPDLIFKAMHLTGIADPALVANVGDTTLDLEAGHRAGVRWNVAVLTGAHDAHHLARAPHTHIIDDIGQLHTIWTG